MSKETSQTTPKWFKPVDFAEELLASQEANWAIETKCDEYLDDCVPDIVAKEIESLDISSQVEDEAHSLVEQAIADHNIDLIVDEAVSDCLLDRDQYMEEVETLKCEVAEIKEIVSELLGDG